VSAAKVYLGGEGQNELGSRCGHPAYQSDDSPGVLEALLRRVRAHGWEVTGACKWCDIRKLRAKGPSPREEQSVLGLVLEAKRAGADILAFTRDADDDQDRPRIVREAIKKAQNEWPTVAIVGATAIPVLEGWILALLGERGTEKLGKTAAQKALVARGFPAKQTQPMVDAALAADLQAIPKDAESLHAWLERASEALPASNP
jgi:hypothetical protein